MTRTKPNFLQLHQLYPLNASWGVAIKQALLFGLFIGLFLAVFQPFGLSEYQHENKLLHLVGYGAVTSFCMLMNHGLFSILLPNWYTEKHWTVGKNIGYTIWLLFTIGLVNWAYTALLGLWPMTIISLIAFQVMTVVVGILPIGISTIVIHNQLLKRSLIQANQLNDIVPQEKVSQDSLITLPSQNQSEELTVKPSEILFIQSSENYVEVELVDKTVLLRNTLKEIDRTLSPLPQFVKCHRSFIVNLQKVNSFSGNAQGLSLTLASYEKTIPVSRAYVQQIKKGL